MRAESIYFPLPGGRWRQFAVAAPLSSSRENQMEGTARSQLDNDVRYGAITCGDTKSDWIGSRPLCSVMLKTSQSSQYPLVSTWKPIDDQFRNIVTVSTPFDMKDR